MVTILTFYPLILKSQPRSHSQWSLAYEGQTPANKTEQIVNLHNSSVLTTVALYVLSLHGIQLSLLHSCYSLGPWRKLCQGTVSIEFLLLRP